MATRNRNRLVRGAEHHLCVDFHADGSGSFFPTTTAPDELARRFRAFLQGWIDRDAFTPGDSAIGVDLPRGAAHHVCLDFMRDGRVVVNLATREGDLMAVSECFVHLLPRLVEHPSAIHCAAGDHDWTDGSEPA